MILILWFVLSLVNLVLTTHIEISKLRKEIENENYEYLYSLIEDYGGVDNVTVPTKFGNKSLFMLAIELNKHSVMQYLIDCKADVDYSPDNNWYCPLDIAICSESEKSLQMLVDNGIDYFRIANKSGLTNIGFDLITCTSLSTTDKLLQLGHDPHIPYSINLAPRDIMLAARHSDAALSLLISHGTDVNAVSETSALLDATAKLDVFVILRLLKRGARVEFRQKFGYLMVHAARFKKAPYSLDDYCMIQVKIHLYAPFKPIHTSILKLFREEYWFSPILDVFINLAVVQDQLKLASLISRSMISFCLSSDFSFSFSSFSAISIESCAIWFLSSVRASIFS